LALTDLDCACLCLYGGPKPDEIGTSFPSDGWPVTKTVSNTQSTSLCLLTLAAEITNLFFIGLFAVEMLVKMYSVGFQGYFVSMFNRFDSFVVVFSIVEEIFTYTGIMPPLGVSVLRCARLLRVFKATRSATFALYVSTGPVMWGHLGHEPLLPFPF